MSAFAYQTEDGLYWFDSTDTNCAFSALLYLTWHYDEPGNKGITKLSAPAGDHLPEYVHALSAYVPCSWDRDLKSFGVSRAEMHNICKTIGVTFITQLEGGDYSHRDFNAWKRSRSTHAIVMN
jgi:hypothetical protein